MLGVHFSNSLISYLVSKILVYIVLQNFTTLMLYLCSCLKSIYYSLNIFSLTVSCKIKKSETYLCFMRHLSFGMSIIAIYLWLKMIYANVSVVLCVIAVSVDHFVKIWEIKRYERYIYVDFKNYKLLRIIGCFICQHYNGPIRCCIKT